MSAPTVTIRSIAAGGDGVASLPDGRTVFVPRTAPGDVVVLGQLQLRKKFARAQIAEILTQGPNRVEPACIHYVRDRCGGCQLMHLDIEAQRSVKQKIVGDALRRIAKLDIEDPEITPAPEPLGYRGKVTFTVKQGRIGFHRLGEPGRLAAIEHCHLLEPSLAELHERLLETRAALPEDTEQVILRIDSTGQRHLVVKTSGAKAWTAGPELAETLGASVVVWWHPVGGAPRAVAGSSETWPATVFEQVNAQVGTVVRKSALQQLLSGWSGVGTAWDLYAGTGATTELLSERGFVVESIERDQRAVELAERLGPAGPRRLVGDVAKRLKELSTPDVVITNPPRTGMAQSVVSDLAESGAKRICYVSCDPATLARDIRRLGDNYRLIHLEAFDQFPQTAHVESVAVMEQA